MFVIISVVDIIAIYFYINTQEQTNIPKTFACPFVPLMRGLSFILLTTTIHTMKGIDVTAWKIFLGYTVVVVIAYFMYGYSHSKLNPNRKKGVENSSHAKPN